MNLVHKRIDSWQTLIKIFSSHDPRTHIGLCVPLHRLHAKTPLDPLYYNPPHHLSISTHTLLAAAALFAEQQQYCTESAACSPVPLPSLYLARLVCVCAVRYLQPPPPPPSPPPPRANPPSPPSCPCAQICPAVALALDIPFSPLYTWHT